MRKVGKLLNFYFLPSGTKRSRIDLLSAELLQIEEVFHSGSTRHVETFGEIEGSIAAVGCSFGA